ncbi:hypothetical protein N7449_001567 [Penicillium cf. viridicatum]|uniref:Uncharacterized protein n=1 Tax=Penicillium cf. viridicatum TaxID=2972119 RepID=A0A9W9T9D8_9EURO|nr:hypothetical protein N7449_001567 [Penicillium cf. viridicatum]
MNPDHDKMLGWNFLYLLNNPYGTIEFRRGAEIWKALRVCPPLSVDSSGLSKLQSYRTVFLDYLTPDISSYSSQERVKVLFVSQDHWGILSPYKLNKLNRKKEEDKRKNVAMTKILQEPYWS